MFRRVGRQVESNDCLPLFSDVSRETLTFCPPNIEKKFPLKGGFVRQKHLGKMIIIDFFDANQCFVVRHKLDGVGSLAKCRKVAGLYCSNIFYFYESADTALITINGRSVKMVRYE